MDLATGRLLDERFRLESLIGSGGMATVYAATDTRLERSVAIKLFHPVADEITQARLAAEARMLAGLSHPGLVKVFDVYDPGGRPYLVMQLVSGGTLRAVINRGPLAPDTVARIGEHLADTLRYVHSRHIVHRDIKPANVLVDRSGRCYLADFGIAKAVGDARLTASGHCVGTAAYLAPEQVAGDGVGPAADIYSLGLVLLECLTGRAEYTGTEAEAAVARLSRQPRVPADLPDPLRRTLTAMTSRDPQARPDAAECAAMFAGSLGTGTGSRSYPLPAPVPDNPTRMLKTPVGLKVNRRFVHAAAAVAMIAGVLTVSLLSGGAAAPAGSGEPPPSQPAQQAELPVVPAVPSAAAGGVVEGSAPQTEQDTEPASVAEQDAAPAHPAPREAGPPPAPGPKPPAHSGPGKGKEGPGSGKGKAGDDEDG